MEYLCHAVCKLFSTNGISYVDIYTYIVRITLKRFFRFNPYFLINIIEAIRYAFVFSPNLKL